MPPFAVLSVQRPPNLQTSLRTGPPAEARAASAQTCHSRLMEPTPQRLLGADHSDLKEIMLLKLTGARQQRSEGELPPLEC